MRYFVVQMTNTSHQTLLEVDVPLRQLWPLVGGIEKQLRAQGVFDQDRLLKRLVPRYESRAREVTVQFVDEVSADLGEAEYDLYFAEMPEDSSRPIQALSLWFCSTTPERVCAVDLPVSWLFGSAREHLMRQVEHRQQVSEGDEFYFSVFLQGQGRPRAPKPAKRRAVILLLPQEPPPPKIETLDRQALHKPAVEITVTDRESLAPAKRSWRDYELKLVGKRKQGDLRVLLNYRAIRQLDKVARASMRQDAETGGFLVGHVYQDEEGELFVDVSGTVDTDQATHAFLKLRSDQDAWQWALDEIERLFPDRRQVGWYHTHLVGSKRLQPVASDAGSRQVFKLARPNLFSSDDALLHRDFFPEPWQVALVVDLKNRTIMFYQWKEGEIAPCQGYYVYYRTPETGA